MTLLDVKLALYHHMENADAYVPEFVYLAAGDEPVDFTWVIGGIQGAKEFTIDDPFTVAAGPPDTRFVDSAGSRRILKFVQRDRLTLEGMYGSAEGVPAFNAYLYRDVVAAIPGPKPPSERDWNGHLYPFFPYVATGATGPTEEQKARAKRLATIFLRRSQFSGRIERLIREDLPVESLRLTGVRNLRLVWHAPEKIPGIEAIFYEAPVTARRPYMRFVPIEGAPISKIHLVDGAPDIPEPKLLQQWSQERTPIPSHDVVIAKVLVKQGYVNIPPIYGTLRMLDDGTADYVLQPSRGVRKLDPADDLRGTWSIVKEATEGFPFLKDPVLDASIFVFGLKLRKDQAALNVKTLQERLPVFTAFFQEISALPGETAVATLRYKCVSNFATEDRVFAFITQILSRKLARGEGTANLVELVAEEFQIDMVEARKRVADKLQNQGDLALVKPETGEFVANYSPGIDISIFGQHPFYTFHIYRVNSFPSLQRITTLLSLLMGASAEDLQVSDRSVRELRVAEKEEVEFGSVAPGASTTAELVAPAPAAVAAPVENSNEFENVTEQEEAAPAAAPAAAYMPEAEPGYEDLFLDEFAAEIGEEEETLEQTHERETAAAATNGVAALPEPPLPQAPVAPAAPAAPAPAAPAAAAALKQEVKERVQEEVSTVTTTKDASIANFFINKLKEADRRLFDYTKTHPSLKKYVQQCQPTDGRQPAVLSQEKYDEMMEEYANDPITFILYPLEEGEAARPDAGKEYYTILRYGTSSEKQHYYLCSQFFCTRDEILVREIDLASTTMRKPLRDPAGKLKPDEKKPGQCPFCRGVVVKNKKAPAANEVILERGVKPQSDNRRHLFIRFLKKTPHPEGFYLPCCFLDEAPVHEFDPAFDKYKDLGIPPRERALVPVAAAARAAHEEESDDDEDAGAAAAEALQPGRQGPTLESGVPQVDYFTVLQTLGKRGKYILGSEKFPLEIGLVTAAGRGEPQVGLLPPLLDTYFKQSPTQFVTRSFTQQTLKEGGTGFLRVGVENRVRYKPDSFLAAVAPFLKMNSAAEVKARIRSVLTPKTFLALNYGNLALEFYKPGDPRPTPAALATWVSAELEIDVSSQTKESLYRLYNSWHNFVEWLASSKTHKEYRHFALMFAQSGLIEGRGKRGITFIVLDILESGKMEVRCPPYGYNDDLMGKNNVGFLFHHWSGVWEPVFYIDNRAPKERKVDAAILLFDGAYKGFLGVWPDIVKQRVAEFNTQCGFVGRSVYASQSAINPMAMIPLSLAYRILRKKGKDVVFEGVVRDAYNHVGALLYRHKGQTSPGFVTIPVADDGDLGPCVAGATILDWDDPDFLKASVMDSLEFYKGYIDTDFSMYPGYTMQFLAVQKVGGKGVPRPLAEDDLDKIIAIKLRNGLYLPVAKPTAADADTIRVSRAFVIDIDEEEWSINKDIAYDRDVSNRIEAAQIEYAELQELFEHLRLTFSNYLATAEVGDLRKTIQDISMDRTLPLYEKRKRLEILLGPIVMNEMLNDEDRVVDSGPEAPSAPAPTPSLLRMDCRLRGAGDCEKAGKCVWLKEAGKCMLHTKKETDLGNGKRISVRLLLLRRLNEELLRFSERRRQIFQQSVSRMAAIDKPITMGSQLIIPEKSMAWFELLRLDWATKDEAPKYLEEMGRVAEATAAPVPLTDETAPPPSLVARLGGDDPAWGGLRLLRAPWKALITGLGLSFETYAVTDVLELTQVRKMVNETGKAIMQVDLRQEGAALDAYKPVYSTFSSVILFVVDERGPALVVQNPSEPAPLPVAALPVAVAEKYKRGKLVRPA
jgi:hypothetical protein